MLDLSIAAETGPDTFPLRQRFSKELNGTLRDFCTTYNLHVSSWVDDDALANLKAVTRAVENANMHLLVVVDEYDRTLN